LVLDLAIPLLGLAIVLLIRPADLLRWTPTGKAWNWYRPKRGIMTPVAAGPSVFDQVAQYHLSYDSIDQPAADQLRGIFAGLNARETQDSEDTTSVLLLTNRTRTEWLVQKTKEQQRTRVLTVIGASISLQESLELLWRRQWIDFRRWNLKEADRKRGLSQVPEALASPCFPTRVRLAHHFLCALATMPVLLSDTTVGSNFVLIFGIVLARRLLRRKISPVGFFRSWIVALLIMAVTTMISLYGAEQNSLDRVGVFVAVVFLVIFPLFMIWNQDKLAFWFPLRNIVRNKKDDELTPPRNWQTLIWVSIYAVVWGMVQFRVWTFFSIL
jgi:hypothetical protein